MDTSKKAGLNVIEAQMLQEIGLKTSLSQPERPKGLSEMPKKAGGFVRMSDGTLYQRAYDGSLRKVKVHGSDHTRKSG